MMNHTDSDNDAFRQQTFLKQESTGITVTMTLLYCSIPVSHDSEPACAIPVSWNSCFIHFIICTCTFPAVTCYRVVCEKAIFFTLSGTVHIISVAVGSIKQELKPTFITLSLMVMIVRLLFYNTHKTGFYTGASSRWKKKKKIVSFFTMTGYNEGKQRKYECLLASDWPMHCFAGWRYVALHQNKSPGQLLFARLPRWLRLVFAWAPWINSP